MEMVNLRWSIEDGSFPARVGGGGFWYITYANVALMVNKEIFEEGFGSLFFAMERFNWMIRRSTGDFQKAHEPRDYNGRIIP